MGDTKESSKQNNFNGPVNFNGSTQFAGRDVINVINGEQKLRPENANYAPEPIWRSPFTLAVLSWISFILGIISLLPISRIFENAFNILKGNMKEVMHFPIQLNMIFVVILLFLFALFFSLRKIAKKQIRVPLLFNYAISGLGERIILEKIHIDKCPICGGKMMYYSKPIEWREYYIDRKKKREVTKKVPALECKRNSEHWYKVDPAQEKLM